MPHHEPFVPFDLMVGENRLLNQECVRKADLAGMPVPVLLSKGGPFSLDKAMAALKTPMHGELDPVEGAAWCVERNNEFDFLCKWVRLDKVDGQYLESVTSAEAIWNWRPLEKDPDKSVSPKTQKLCYSE